MQAEVYTCKNGLTAIVSRKPAFPVVSVQVWVGTGSEHEGEHAGAGLSHLLEHMVFKGAGEFNAQQLNEEVAALGGLWNAYTTTDRTVFHIDGPSAQWQSFLHILTQLVFRPTFPQEEFEKEREVIRREMAMYNDDPRDAAYRALIGTLYKVHPRRLPVIGEQKRFDSLTHADMLNYHRHRYTPGNMFVCVVGDVEPAAVFTALESEVADILPTPSEKLPTVQEPRQWGKRLYRCEFAQPTSALMLAWRIPHTQHPDAAALAVLSAVLGDGRAAWLYKTFHDERAIAHDTNTSILPAKQGEGAFVIEADVERDKRDELRDALLEYVTTLPQADFTQGVQRAQRQLKAQRVKALSTVQGCASILGISWHHSRNTGAGEEWAQALSRVTPADLTRVAATYLTPERLTEVSVDPTGTNRADTATEGAATLPTPVVHELPNGLRVVLREDHRVPLVSTALTLGAGCRTETEQTAGINNLLAECMLKGTPTRSAAELADAVENLGGTISCTAGNNSLMLKTRALAEDALTMLSLLADTALNPTLPQEAMSTAQEDMVADILDSREDPAAVAFVELRRACFGTQSYGNHPDGTPESVQSITRELLQQHHARLMCGHNAVLAISGDFEPAAILAAAGELFAAMPAGTPAELTPTPQQQPADLTIPCDKDQAVLALAVPGLTATAEETPLQLLFDEWCRDMAGPIFSEIREQRGLAYYAASAALLGTDAGCMFFYLGTSPQAMSEARTALTDLLARLAAEGMPAEALERARATVLSSRLLAEQSADKLCSSMAVNTLLGLPPDYAEQLPDRLRAVTPQQMNDFIARLLSPHATRTVVTVIPKVES